MKLPHMIGVESSNVHQIGWHEGDLFVRFKGGGVYRYADVPKDTYHQGLEAKSPGGWFRESVRGRYAHVPVEHEPHDR